MGAPDVYLRSKVPEDMYYILQQFAEIRKLSRLSLVRDFNLFPETETLLTLERKYGDSLNVEDLTGRPAKPKKKKVVQQEEMGTTSTSLEPKSVKSAENFTHSEAQSMSKTEILSKKDEIKIEEASKKKHDDKRKADTDCKN